jgi:hypothetical protein
MAGNNDRIPVAAAHLGIKAEDKLFQHLHFVTEQ